jgi:hypothetical protein
MNLKPLFKKLFYGIIVSVFLLSFNPIPAFAQSLNTTQSTVKEFTLEDTGLSSDDVIKGALVSRDYGVLLPVNWNHITDAEVSINFSHSQALNPKSSMTVDWNNVRLGSIQLTNENIDHGQMTVSIPVDSIKQGYNALHIEFYMGISDNFCSDYDNPAVWATVQKSTFFRFDTDLTQVQPDLGNLPSPFFDESSLAGNHVTMVISDKPGMGEINSLAVVNAKLGELSGGWRTISTDLISLSDAKKDGIQGNIIFIGTIDTVNQLDPSINISDEQEKGGLLEEFPSPYDKTALILAITGKTQEDVEKAGRAFANGSLYSRLSGAKAVITGNATSSNGVKVNQLSTTLEELGYSNGTASGTREQKINYTIPLTSLWQTKTDAILNLHFLHSVVNSKEDPTLTISVNSLPVGSVKLTEANANGGQETFQIPLDFFHVGNNDLAIQANMQVFNSRDDVDLYCADNQIAEAWLTIDNDSQLKFPSLPDSSTVEISNFPYIFMGKSDLSQLAFVMPKSASFADLKALSILALSLGRSAVGEPIMPHVVNSDQVSQNGQDYPNRILIGLPLNNPAILSANDQLPLSFNISTGVANPLPVLDTIDSGKISTGYIEAYLSGDKVPNLIVSGNDENGLLLAANQLSLNTNIAKLSGDVAITTGQDREISFWGKSLPTTSAGSTVVAENELSLSFMWFQRNAALYTAIGFLTLAILLFLIRIVIVLRTKKMNEEEHE